MLGLWPLMQNKQQKPYRELQGLPPEGVLKHFPLPLGFESYPRESFHQGEMCVKYLNCGAAELSTRRNSQFACKGSVDWEDELLIAFGNSLSFHFTVQGLLPFQARENCSFASQLASFPYFFLTDHMLFHYEITVCVFIFICLKSFKILLNHFVLQDIPRRIDIKRLMNLDFLPVSLLCPFK